MYQLKLNLMPMGYNREKAYEIPDGDELCEWCEDEGPIGSIPAKNGWYPEVKPRETRQAPQEPTGR